MRKFKDENSEGYSNNKAGLSRCGLARAYPNQKKHPFRRKVIATVDDQIQRVFIPFSSESTLYCTKAAMHVKNHQKGGLEPRHFSLA